MKAVLCSFAAWLARSAAELTVVDHANAVPSGDHSTEKSLEECEARCAGECTQFTWNTKSGHCFTSTSLAWHPTESTRTTSGCDAARVSACPGAGPTPSPAPTPAPSSCTSALSWVWKTNESLGYCHMAMIEALDNQTLVVSFQAAKVHEGYNDQAIYYSRSTDLGVTWSPLEQLVSGGMYAVWGPTFHHDRRTGRLHLFYAQSVPSAQKSDIRSDVGGDILHIASEDKGLTWSDPSSILPYDLHGKTIPKITANKPVVTASGSWLLPFWQTPCSSNDTEVQQAGVLISDDAGNTWSTSYVAQPTKLIENTLAIARNGSVLQLFRTGEGHLYESWSHDHGQSWTEPSASQIPNPNAKTFVFTDSLGDMILAYNPTKKRPRNPLALAISTDDGGSFQQYCNLDPGMTTKDLEYPTAVEVNGKVFTVFSADHYTGIKLSVTDLPSVSPLVV